MAFLLVRFNIYQEIGYVKYKIAFEKGGQGGFFILGNKTLVVHERLACVSAGWKTCATL
jgi:hypothetical protein